MLITNANLKIDEIFGHCVIVNNYSFDVNDELSEGLLLLAEKDG